MFGRNDQGNPGNAAGPVSNQAGGPIPRIPPLRTYEVTRCNGELSDEGFPVLTKELIRAHDSLIMAQGDILQFCEYIIDPVDGPRVRIVECIQGWERYRELPPTNLLTDFSGPVQ